LIRQPDANWGSSSQEQTYRTMLSAIFRLQQTGEHIKNFHPQVLVLAGDPTHRPSLVDLAVLITHNKSLLMVGDVKEEKLMSQERKIIEKNAYDFIKSKKIKAFYNLIDDIDMETGVKLMIQSSGFGVLSPNIVMMGYKGNWMTCKSIELKSYFNAVQ
jgi:solute carrier family 12 sodium/potassium/chloride transporter 2